MKVSELMKVLDGVAIGLSDVAKKASEELAAFRKAMQPFAEQKVNDFIAFLAVCDEYKRTGAISAAAKRPSAPRGAAAGAPTVEEAITAFRSILGQINLRKVSGQLIGETVAHFKRMTKVQLEDLLKRLEIQGKPKSKDDAVGKIKQVLDTQLEMFIRSHPSTQGPPI